MSTACIQTQGLNKAFSDKVAIKELDLHIEQGGIHALVGSNGAGKSTLFRLLLGVETPTSGTVHVLGERSTELKPETRGKIGYVNEEHTLPNWMTVSALLKMQKSFYRGWNQAVYDNAIAYFDVQNKQKISSLSRGERAGFNLAMALAQSPKLLILDEPTLGLDVVAKQSILEAVMFTESEQDGTIIYCSHQMEEIERIADNLIIMERGELSNNSAPEDFVERVSSWIGDFSNATIKSESIEGLLSRKRIDDLEQIMVVDRDLKELQAQLKDAGVSNLQAQSVSLHQAVNAFLSKNHAAPSSTQRPSSTAA